MDSPPSGSKHSSATPHPRFRRALFAGVAFLVITGGADVVIEQAPAPIAIGLARAWLRDRGVESAIELSRFSDHSLSARIRLGDPSDPDLTIDRLDLTYRMTGPWRGEALAFTPLSARLVHPRLRVRLRAGKADFGQLRGLIRWIESQPPSRQPLPDLRIDDGQATISTVGGDIRLTGSGVVTGGREGGFQGRIAPFRQRLPGSSLGGGGGDFAIKGANSRLSGRVMLGSTVAADPAGSVAASAVSLTAEMPTPAPDGSWVGRSRFDLALVGVEVTSPAGRLTKARAQASAAGTMRIAGGLQAFSGTLSGRLASTSASGSGAMVKGPALDINLAAVTVESDGAGFVARGGGRARLAVDRIDIAAGHVVRVAIDARLAAGGVTGRNGRVDVQAALSGDAAGQGAIAPELAARLAKLSPALNGERPYARAFSAAGADLSLSVPDWRLNLSPGRARFALAAPARIRSATGAVLAVSGKGELAAAPEWRATGATELALSGGDLPEVSVSAPSWSATSRTLDARLAIQSRFTLEALGPSSMNAEGHLALSPRQIRFDLSGCAPFSAQRLGVGEARAAGVALRLCPDTAPLWLSDPAHWRAAGRIEGLGGNAPGPGVGLTDASLTFTAAGAAAGLQNAGASLNRAVLIDRTEPVRFRPLTLAGAVRLAHGVWTGGFGVSTAGGHRLGEVTVNLSTGEGGGRLGILADGVDFAPGALQPVDLSPLAAGFRSVSGHLGFDGAIVWSAAAAARGDGILDARSIQFTGPLGPVRNLNTTVRLISLTPLVSAPDQSLTIAAIDTITPITDVKMLFDFDADTARVKQLSGAVAGGVLSVEPITAPLSGDLSFSSSVVLHNVDLGAILDASNLSDKIKLAAKVDGRVPFAVGPTGLRIDHGSLAAVGGGRLSISRSAFVGAATAATPAAQTSFAQDFAYQAMENLTFDTLDATVSGQPHDRLGILFHIKGRHDPPTPQRATIALADVLRGQALSKPVPLPSGTKIDLTLDTSLNFGDLVTALQAAWTDAMKPADAASAKQQAEHR